MANENLHEAGKLIEDNLDELLSEQAEIFNKSKENLKKLITIYDPNKTVAFVGAGVSKPLGILDWGDLIKKLIKKCSDDFQKEHEQDIENSEKWPELAEQIYQRLKEENKEEQYLKTIKEGMKPSYNTTTLTLVKMVLAINVCLTTNFERSIEHAFEFLKYIANHLRVKKYNISLEKRYLPEIEQFPDSNKRYIYYLHADIDNDIFILRKSQYDTYYPSISREENGVKNVENCLRNFFVNKNIIFIGFSFADRYLREYFLKLSKDLERENIIHHRIYNQEGRIYNPSQKEHFIIIDFDTWVKNKNYFEECEKRQILPIVYKTDMHLFIEKLFEYLSKENINAR